MRSMFFTRTKSVFFIAFAMGGIFGIYLHLAFSCRSFRRTFRHHFDFFTGGSQCILCRTNDFLLALPIGHFQSFLEGLYGGGIFGAVG